MLNYSNIPLYSIAIFVLQMFILFMSLTKQVCQRAELLKGRFSKVILYSLCCHERLHVMLISNFPLQKCCLHLTASCYPMFNLVSCLIKLHVPVSAYFSQTVQSQAYLLLSKSHSVQWGIHLHVQDLYYIGFQP